MRPYFSGDRVRGWKNITTHQSILNFPVMCLLLDANKREVYFYCLQFLQKVTTCHIFIYCERSELICKVRQFGLGCIKNCAR